MQTDPYAHMECKDVVDMSGMFRPAVQRVKTLEIREILMEGHAEREQLTTASTGN